MDPRFANVEYLIQYTYYISVYNNYCAAISLSFY
jgi:hypothetical protein